MKFSAGLLQQLLFAVPGVLGAITVDINDAESVKAAAALVADDLLTFYQGDELGETPGILNYDDYYWWTGSVLWGSLLDFRARTGNTTYDDVIFQGLQWQVGDNNDYLPRNWTATEGNDDQGLWAQAALVAAQTNFTEAADAQAQWPAIAQNVFTEQSSDERRVSDSDTACDGALRWQIFTFNNGYNYVNTISNALYFSLGAQLAWLNDNKTASDEAIKTYDLLTSIGLVTDDFDVYDGLTVPECDSINKFQFSYVAATLLEGAAYTYNYTGGDDTWKTRVDGHVSNILSIFFPDGVAVEPSCESIETCTSDMYFFKGILHRSLAWTMKMAPHTADTILPVLKTSAVAAVSTCTGGDNGRMCGFAWSNGTFDVSNAGAQSSVLGALVSVLEITDVASSGSSGSGSSSSGNGSSSSSGSSSSNSTSTDGKSMGTNFGISFSALFGALTIAALFA